VDASKDKHPGMLRHRPRAAVMLLCAVAIVLIGLGVTWDAWWTVAGGMTAAIAATWMATEPARRGPEGPPS
jgi:membrane protein YdbS with pleckstrin-like domain